MSQNILKYAPLIGALGFMASGGVAISRTGSSSSSRWFIAAWGFLVFMFLSIALIIISHV